jgi:hypothetical protein
MPSSESLRAGGQMRRQLAKQQRQLQQQQLQQGERVRTADRELPAKQNQTRHNPVAESWQRGTFTSDQ